MIHSTSSGLKVLITGGAGFIGSHLADFLIDKGYEVTVIDNLSWGKKEFFAHHINNPKYHFIKHDLLDYQGLQSKLPSDVDTVFHLAANSDIMRSAKNPEVDFQNTILATFNLLKTMKNKGIKKIFYTSGSGVYGDIKECYAAEDFGPLLPVSFYGATKLAAEALINSFVNMYSMQAWIVRPANIIGSRPTHGVVFDFFNKLKKNPKILEILGNGQQCKSYVYISDFLEAIYLVWKKAEKPIDIFNISSDDYITVNRIAKIIIQEMGLKNVKLKYTGGNVGWKGDVPIVRLRNNKLKKLNWQIKNTSAEAVRKTVRSLIDYV